MIKGDFKLIKNINEQVVLNLIRENEIISSSELVQTTGMRPSTIFNILKDLTSKELIFNLGKGESTEKGGKKPYLWKLNNEAAFVIGVDIEIGELTAVVLDLTGKDICKKVYHTKLYKTVDEILFQIEESLKDIIGISKIDESKILGVGFAFAGVVDYNSGVVVSTDVISTQNIPLIDLMSERISYPIMIENNANAAALGAKWVGAGKGSQSFITVLTEINKNVGGMGIGLVLKDELYQGSSYCAGELNSLLPKIGDILVTIRNKLDEGHILRDYTNRQEEIDISLIVEAAQKGDEAAKLFAEILGHLIGKSISKSVALLNPERLILAGDISELGDLIIDPIRRVIELETLTLSSESLDIVTSIYGHYSVAIGASALILSEYFKVPAVKMNSLANSK